MVHTPVNIILLEPEELSPSGEVRLRDDRARHMVRVLEVEPSHTVRIGLVDGPPGLGTVIAVSPDAVTLLCVFDAETPERPRVDLLLALPRPKVIRRLWAQLAALGVGRVMLTNAERVERNYFDTHFLSPAIYRPLLIEGLQQARDTRVPLVSIHRQFRGLVEDGLERMSDAATRVVAHPGSEASVSGRLKSAPTGTAPTANRVLLAIGPEGGWNEFELGLLEARGFQRVAMGRRILRSDTACVALLTLVHDALA